MELDARQRELAAAKEVPLLRFQAASGLPYWGFGLACGLSVFLMLVVPGMLVFDGDERSEALGAALFFGTICTILATFTVPVYRGAANDLRALKPILPISDDVLETLARGLTRATPQQVSRAVLIGIATGVVHSYVLGHQNLPLAFLIPQATATIGLWVVMYATLSKMVINAAVFSQLGNMAEPDLLRPSSQAPFGSAAIRPAMFLIGTLCAYPFLAIGDGNPVDGGVWLGIAASVVSLFGIVAMPLGGIRDRIRARRVEILTALDQRLEAIGSANLGTVSADTLKDMDTILDMRERVANAPAWPLDLAGVRRILLYIVLPPLTWAAAALVEMMIDGAL